MIMWEHAHASLHRSRLQRLQQTRSPMVHHTRLRGSEGDNREVGETPSDLPNPLGRRRYRQPAERFEG